MGSPKGGDPVSAAVEKEEPDDDVSFFCCRLTNRGSQYMLRSLQNQGLHYDVLKATRQFQSRHLAFTNQHPLSHKYPFPFTHLPAMSAPTSKRQKTSSSSPAYELLYWPGIPGRGEHVRLCFEETGTPYKDVCNSDKDGMGELLALKAEDSIGDKTNPPILAPPVLRHGDLILAQTPNIVLYLAPKLGLAGPEDDENAIYLINQLALTALDGLSNEAHDTHHPIAIGLYYEDQKEEAKRKSKDYIDNRLPKFIGYFERVLQGPASKGGEWLYGGQVTFADLVFWQCLDGVTFAFPKAMKQLKESGKYGKVFELYDRVKGRESIKNYLASDRRKDYSMGIYRQYPELDTGEV